MIDRTIAFNAWWLSLLLVLAAACAGPGTHQQGIDLIEQGSIEAGLAKLQQAANTASGGQRARLAYLREKERALHHLLSAADGEHAAGHFAEAEALYQRVRALEPGNERAHAGLAALNRSRRHLDEVRSAQALFDKSEIEAAVNVIRPVLLEDPQQRQALVLTRQIEAQRLKSSFGPPALKSKYEKPLVLEFRDASLKLVFDALSRSTGINFILDRDVRGDAKTTIFARGVAVEDTLDLLLVQNQLEKKILSNNTVLIYPNNPQKAGEYQDLLIKSFYLENADPKQIHALIKTMLKTEELFIDEKLNLVVMRDTPQAIRLAEKLVASQDLAEPEVVLEVEVLEASRTKLSELGIRWPDQFTLTAVPLDASRSALSDYRGLDSDRINISPRPSAVLNFRKVLGDAEILASPRIRVRNREKAKILIGDRVPVISSIASPTTGGDAFFTDTIQYLDVGLKLDVEPNIHFSDDVSIRINLEVSTLGEQVTTRNGSTAFRIGTRNASTLLQLRDGETQMLMGLIRDDERRNASKVPLLGSLPVLGRLFSSRLRDGQKTEIVLSITPRLVRRLKRVDAQVEEFWSGTARTLRTEPFALRSVKESAPGASLRLESPATAGSPRAPATQSEQMQSLPPTTQQVPTAEHAQPEPAAPASAQLAGAQARQGLNLAWQGPKEARVGERFTVTLNARSDAPVVSAALQIAFDPAALEVAQVVEGSFMKKNGAATNFTQRLDAAAGKLTLRLVRAEAGGASGEGDLAVLTFTAKQPKAQAQIQVVAASPVGAGNAPVASPPTTPYAIAVR